MSYRSQIITLLEKHGFSEVTYVGGIRLSGKREILFYDADFLDQSDNTYVGYREFLASEIKTDMIEVISLLRKMKRGAGFKIARTPC